MSTPVLLKEAREGGILVLTLNRPDRRNALSGELVTELLHAFREAGEDDATRVVVLTGTGDKAFSSGADLDPMAAAAGPYAMHRSRHAFVDLVRAIRSCGRPVVGRVAGHVAAGGLGIVAACDLVVAADDVHFSAPEVKVGLFPMMIMSLLARNIGRKKLMEMLLTGDRFSAADAENIGLINYAVPRADLDDRVDALAAKVAGFSPAVLRLGRDAFHAMEDMPLDNALEYLCAQLTVNTLTEDAAEGITAFITRREPVWKGR